MKTAEQVLNKWCGEPLKENVAFIEQEYALKAMEEYAEQFKPKKLTVDDLFYGMKRGNTIECVKYLNEKTGAR